MKKYDNLRTILEKMSSYELSNVETFVKELKENKYKEERINVRNDYEKGKEARKRAEEKFQTLVPSIRIWLLKNLKQGDIITCKGYKGYKKVVQVNENSVFSMCGYMRKGKFDSNGYGSENTLEYVTAILRDGSWKKVKDLLNS